MMTENYIYLYLHITVESYLKIEQQGYASRLLNQLATSSL